MVCRNFLTQYNVRTFDLIVATFAMTPGDRAMIVTLSLPLENYIKFRGSSCSNPKSCPQQQVIEHLTRLHAEKAQHI